ncbi:hypothetical protein B0H13DRAFT_2263350 [Mycena leptocephala]|nr:hypothetical protein B0H13DRAFT_2263350 [Mycena leptocephala]
MPSSLAEQLEGLSWSQLFDAKAASLPSWATNQLKAMTPQKIERDAYTGCALWQELTYRALVNDAGHIPSGELTLWRSRLSDHKENLESLAEVLGLPNILPGISGRDALGCVLEVLANDRKDKASALRWITNLLRPVLPIARKHNEERLAALKPHDPARSHRSHEKPDLIPSPSRRTSKTARARPADFEVPGATPPDVASPPRKRARHQSPSTPVAGPSRLPLTPLSPEYTSPHSSPHAGIPFDEEASSKPTLTLNIPRFL